MLERLEKRLGESAPAALRCAPVNTELLGMKRAVSEDSVRRGLAKIEERQGLSWLQSHLDDTTTPLLSEPWVLDMDSTVKPLGACPRA